MFEKRKRWKALRAAVQQNDVAEVTRIAASLTLRGKKEYFDLCSAAILQGNSETLAALLKAGFWFSFNKRADENTRLTLQLVSTAYVSPNMEATLPVLYNSRKTKGPLALDASYFLNKAAPVSLLEACLKSDCSWPGINTCIQKTGLFSTQKLEFILTFAPAKKDTNTLTNALITVTARGDEGDLDKAGLLLAHGANPDIKEAEALHNAVMRGDQKMVDLLLPCVDLADRGEKIITRLKCKNAAAAIIESIKAATEEAVQRAAAPRFKRLSGDTLEQVQLLSNGSTLTTLYNFAAKQQKNIVTKNGDDIGIPIETFEFKDLDKAFVEAMEKEFRSLAPAQSPASLEKAVSPPRQMGRR